jgi:hypothetical protein
MAWDIYGTGHHNGTTAERYFVGFLNQGGHKIFPFDGEFIRAEHRGKTKTIVDAVILTSKGEVKFSIKYADKGLSKTSGTFLNTSSLITEMRMANNPIVWPLQKLLAIRDREIASIPNPNIRYSNRDEYEANYFLPLLSEACGNFPADLIYRFLKTSVTHLLECDYIVHIDGKENNYSCYRPEGHPVVHAINNNWKLDIKPQTHGKKSRNLIHIDENGQEFDYGLRFIVKHNNGVSDLFKMNSAARKEEKNKGGGSFVTTINQNPSSVPTIIQIIEDKGNLIRYP